MVVVAISEPQTTARPSKATTLTEKMLLFGRAIEFACEVRAKANRRKTRSEWMGIERERGIVVTSGSRFTCDPRPPYCSAVT